MSGIPEAACEIIDDLKLEVARLSGLCCELQTTIDNDGYPSAADYDRMKARAEAAQALVAKMHAAAVGEVQGPSVGPVDDVAALRAAGGLMRAWIGDRETSITERWDALQGGAK